MVLLGEVANNRYCLGDPHMWPSCVLILCFDICWARYSGDKAIYNIKVYYNIIDTMMYSS
jgi:hypothetical protein